MNFFVRNLSFPFKSKPDSSSKLTPILAAFAFKSYRRRNYEVVTSALNDSFEFGYDQLSQKLEWASQILPIQEARIRLTSDKENHDQNHQPHVIRPATTSAQYTNSLNNLMVTLKARDFYYETKNSFLLCNFYSSDDYLTGVLG